MCCNQTEFLTKLIKLVFKTSEKYIVNNREILELNFLFLIKLQLFLIVLAVDDLVKNANILNLPSCVIILIQYQIMIKLGKRI